MVLTDDCDHMRFANLAHEVGPFFGSRYRRPAHIISFTQTTWRGKRRYAREVSTITVVTLCSGVTLGGMDTSGSLVLGASLTKDSLYEAHSQLQRTLNTRARSCSVPRRRTKASTRDIGTALTL